MSESDKEGAEMIKELKVIEYISADGDEEFTSLQKLIQEGDCSEFIEQIKKSALNIFALQSYKGETLLHTATQAKEDEVVKELIEAVFIFNSNFRLAIKFLNTLEKNI